MPPKYSAGASNRILPAPLLPFVYQEVRRSTLAAHVALGCRGVSRADFRFDDRTLGRGDLIFLEVDIQPGMTETRLCRSSQYLRA
jgi:D-alanine-D-alanine ligase